MYPNIKLSFRFSNPDKMRADLIDTIDSGERLAREGAFFAMQNRGGEDDAECLTLDA